MKKEPLELSCKSILQLLGNEKFCTSPFIDLIRADLHGKFLDLASGTVKNEIACKILLEKMPSYAEPYYKYLTGDAEMHQKKYFDILIFTVVPSEFRAVKSLLGLEQDERELTVHGFRFWKTTILCKRTGKSLCCLVSMIGEATNVFAAVAVTTALCKYRFGLAILVGIAAGAPKTSFADVIIADRIVDYESKRLEPDKAKNRPHHWNLDERLRKQVDYFLADSQYAGSGFSDFFKTTEALLFDKKYTDCTPSISRAVILAGDKLLADGTTIPKLIEEYHQQAKAVEMESNGFALACASYGVPWMVFRGISDFGDPDKPDLKKYQQNAALSAILACKLFLEESYDNFTQNDNVSYSDGNDIDF